ncbi:hypothetical protein, partial [Hallella sp.]|uniref:hypothetical protein n=1 Tax=Hallella sp. TaxID=2980186 RepID=UPI00307FFC6C
MQSKRAYFYTQRKTYWDLIVKANGYLSSGNVPAASPLLPFPTFALLTQEHKRGGTNANKVTIRNMPTCAFRLSCRPL